MQLKPADKSFPISYVFTKPIRIELARGVGEAAPDVGVFDARRRVSAARRKLKAEAVRQQDELKQRQLATIVDRILADLGR